MSARGIIRLGDKTTGGGQVIACRFASIYTSDGKPVAVLGDKATCHKHKGVFAFVEADSTVTCHDRGTVLQGHKLACGCFAISSESATHIVDKDEPTFAPVPAPAPTSESPASAAAVEPASASVVAAPPMPVSLEGDEPADDKPPAPVLVTLRIGVFFDGTANNANNARIGAQCRAVAKDKHEEAVLLAGCENVDDSSYSNGPTNIYKLYSLYRDDTVGDAPVAHGGDYFIRLYIEGDGTNSGEGDSTISLAIGDGDTGMARRVEDAFYKELKTALGLFAEKYPDAYTQAIELDIFGFSRGAAEARDFLHKVNQRGHGPLGDVIPGANLKLKPGFAWKTDVHAGFVGLFDTVSHLGLDPDTSVAENADMGFYLCLPEDCATRGVVHLTARDECRVNFPLTSAAPPYQDRPLPGVHSDIGGGYLDNAEEVVWLIRPITHDENARRPLETTRPYREAQKQLRHLQAQDPANAASMRVHCWAVPYPEEASPWVHIPMQTVAATVEMRRTLSNAYAGIPLRAMYVLASRAGVPWSQSPDDVPSMQLPSELTRITAMAMSYAQMDEPPRLSPEEEQLLRRRYLHHSADWHPITENATPLTFLYVNRPTDDGQRVIIPNEDKA